MTTIVSDNAAVSQVAADVRNLEGYADLLSIFASSEATVTESKLEVAEAILVFVREQLDGLESTARDNRRAALMGCLGEDTGYSKGALSALVKAAALNEWVSENLPEGFDENPLLGISWRVVVSALAPCVKRNTEQEGETHDVNVHPACVGAFCEVLATLASKPFSIDAAKATLAASGVQGLDGLLAFAFVARAKRGKTSGAADANTGDSKPVDAKPQPEPAERETIAEATKECNKPGDYAGKALSILIACQLEKRSEAFRALGNQSIPCAGPLLAGMADAVQQIDRDSDGLAMAKRLLKAAESLAAICRDTFPALGSK